MCFCIPLKFFVGFHSLVGQPKGNLFYLSNSAPSEIFCSQRPTLVVGFLLSAVLHFLSLMNVLSVCSPQSNLSGHTPSICPSWVQKVRILISAVLLLINSYRVHSKTVFRVTGLQFICMLPTQVSPDLMYHLSIM